MDRERFFHMIKVSLDALDNNDLLTDEQKKEERDGVMRYLTREHLDKRD